MFTPELYPEVCEWWKAHNWPPVELEALSDFGVVVFDDAMPICAGWLYVMTRYWGLIEWMVMNPKAPMKLRPLAVELLIERLEVEGKGFGVKAFFTSLKSTGLIRLYARRGFVVADTGMTNMVKVCR